MKRFFKQIDSKILRKKIRQKVLRFGLREIFEADDVSFERFNTTADG
tara:strand:+ start:177 stop:317 length:141 start_codon:yes stop_codon:yes gene_type:complete